ncbi:aspartyl-phosphate phosphatase Spo0E family protein [Sulfobacillus thermosulfidooxidans]|uniref:aspartyl-phosphate phosphatase Spo0E family protein n=1 Tax=Sulfobacillus thermosulfidooxidans TaxID=28034 RepID=UPI0006B61DC2|nr:aspartyl-phosphate phosphatase Spo0E family protein [Sulfobacillus thermosulfidooxidans]
MTATECQQILRRIAALRQQLLDVASDSDMLTDPQVIACSQALDRVIEEWYLKSSYDCERQIRLSS